MRAFFDSILDRQASPGAGPAWAIVLAGGDGRRLEEEAKRFYGYARPKQYCAFGGDQTLIERTVQRALALVPEDRVVVVINRSHVREARECLSRFPRLRLVAQPSNADTLPGVLLGVLTVLRAVPDALTFVLPSDHYIDDTAAFARSLADAARVLTVDPERLVLLGATPAEPEEGYGWIVPRRAEAPHWAAVASFREKPPLAEVRSLMQRGALLNTFVMVGSASVLAKLCARRAPAWWRGMCAALAEEALLEDVYRTLPTANFSREVLEAEIEALRVMPLRGVEWSDIGTPDRLDRARQAEQVQMASK